MGFRDGGGARRSEFRGNPGATTRPTGGFPTLFDDDDNNNGGSDMNEAGATDGEDDLVALTIGADDSEWGSVSLSFVSGSGTVQVFENDVTSEEGRHHVKSSAN